MILLSFALLFMGFAGLSLAMKRHYPQLQPIMEKNSQQRSKQVIIAIRLLAYSCLLTGLFFCINSQGISIGFVFWLGLLTLAALLQAMLLSYRPRWVFGFGLMLLGCTLFSVI